MAALGWLRAVFPAWRFFDRAVASPRLWIRYAAAGGPLGPWTALEILAPCSRRRTRWAFAAADNLTLAYQAVVEQLVAELGELELDPDGADDGGAGEIERDPRVTGLVGYALVSRIARAQVPGEARLQWKIVVPDGSDYVVSPIFEAEAA
ncbi:MAG TPA: hypothetical protein VGC42_10225 [Kofleriaceae bacterium]